jgi:hypothetical protein
MDPSYNQIDSIKSPTTPVTIKTGKTSLSKKKLLKRSPSMQKSTSQSPVKGKEIKTSKSGKSL